jgi:hypothetical protein
MILIHLLLCYMEFCNKTLELLKTKIPNIRHIELKEMDIDDDKYNDCMGYTHTEAVSDGKWTYINSNNRSYPIKATKIIIRTIDYDQNTLQNKKLLQTLLHETAHCIAPHTEVKVKKKWYIDEHTDLFYYHYLTIIRVALELKFDISSQLLNLKNLKRYDQINLLDNSVIC